MNVNLIECNTGNINNSSSIARISSSSSTYNEEDVKLGLSYVTLNIGESMQINVYPSEAVPYIRKWESSQPSIASVTNSGFVTALSKGTSIIWVYFNGNGGYARRCVITVK